MAWLVEQRVDPTLWQSSRLEAYTVPLDDGNPRTQVIQLTHFEANHARCANCHTHNGF
jgi:hypothetical protein